MLSVYLLTEGYTEQAVTENVIQPHLESLGFHVRTSIIVTKRPAGGLAMRGGVSSWSRLSTEIRRVLRDPTIDILTTLIDYYGVPGDAPGMDNRPIAGPIDRVSHVERAIGQQISDPRFIPHLILHELETWVLASAAWFDKTLGESHVAARLSKVVSDCGGPEMVDDGPNSAPSKRIIAAYPSYNKVGDGPQAIADLGVSALRAQCPHAGEWLSQLEALA